jgi:4-amino-4-deoxy-L-arabinose transferase-like glycosyltransferase
MAQAVDGGKTENVLSAHGPLADGLALGWRWLLVLAAAAAAWKAILLALAAFPFNSDEAIVGLMARHILQGERPIFFYGQAYLGSLDAFLVASVMALMGQTISAIRWTQVLVFGGTVMTTALLAGSAFRSRFAGLAAGILMAVPTVNVTLYTTVSIGGYGEALLIGNGLLLAIAYVDRHSNAPLWLVLTWGLLAGLGFWAFGLTLVYLLPTSLVLAISFHRSRQGGLIRSVAVAALAFIVGASPWFVSALRNGPSALMAELFGSAIAGASSGSLLAALGGHLVNLALFGPTVIMGLRPPWGVELLAAPLAPVPIIFWLAALGFVAWRLRAGISISWLTWALAGVALLDLAGFILTPFGADPSGRYFLPMMVPMAVFGAGLLATVAQSGRRRFAYAALAAVMVYNAAATVDAAASSPTGLTTQFDPIAQVDQTALPDLIRFLQDQDLTRGYTNYWVAYPLAFRSGEELIFVPALPYHQDFRYTPRDSRYRPYAELVQSSSKVGYITTHHPALNSVIEAGLRRLSVGFRVTEIGPYTVYYGLSRAVRPAELDLPSGGGDP